MENIFLSSVQFVSDNRFWILPGSLVGMILAVVIDGIVAARRKELLR